MLVQTKMVEGAIAEFGSFAGHSGLIIARVVEWLGVTRPIYLCDTFDLFPTETVGADQFWTARMAARIFSESRIRFCKHTNVHLVKGEFSRTIDTIPERLFSQAIDCDSYSAVRFVADKVYPKLSRGGVMMFEDYGHDFV